MAEKIVSYDSQRVGDKWGDATPANDRLVGLEIEVENAPGINLREPEATRQPHDHLLHWSAIKDGSLRNNGAEFVSFPTPISKVSDALKELFEYQNDLAQDWKPSIRTGIHVHVNVRDFGAAALNNLMMAYTLAEPALFEYVGKDREECIYCVPWYRASNEALLASRIFSKRDRRTLHSSLKDSITYLSGSASKYASLYLGPLSRIGTVEFRHAPTWKSVPQIRDWAWICHNIVAYSMYAESPARILEIYETNPNRFPYKVTGGLLEPYKDYAALCTKTGAELLANMLYPTTENKWIRLMDDHDIPIPEKSFPPPPVPVQLNDIYNTAVSFQSFYTQDLPKYKPPKALSWTVKPKPVLAVPEPQAIQDVIFDTFATDTMLDSDHDGEE